MPLQDLQLCAYSPPLGHIQTPFTRDWPPYRKVIQLLVSSIVFLHPNLIFLIFSETIFGANMEAVVRVLLHMTEASIR